MPTYTAHWKLLGGGGWRRGTRVFPLFVLIFVSSSKLWTQFSSFCYKSTVEILMFRVLEMSTVFRWGSGVSILGTYLVDRLFIHKNPFKTMWTEPELICWDLAIRWTIIRLLSKTIRWMASTCSSMVKVFGRLERKSSSTLSLNSASHFTLVGWLVFMAYQPL